jgi:hypothetical protein
VKTSIKAADERRSTLIGPLYSICVDRRSSAALILAVLRDDKEHPPRANESNWVSLTNRLVLGGYNTGVNPGPSSRRRTKGEYRKTKESTVIIWSDCPTLGGDYGGVIAQYGAAGDEQQKDFPTTNESELTSGTDCHELGGHDDAVSARRQHLMKMS